MRKVHDDREIAASLRKVLNSHGYPFQYAVIRRAQDLWSSQAGCWLLEASEFPVVAGGTTTHIDFVLASRSMSTFLVAECKRADPAKARWCFAHAPYTRRGAVAEELLFDQFQCSPANLVSHQLCLAFRPTYHLGLELRTGATGDGIGQTQSAINQAVTQVIRATSGLINHRFEFNRRSCSEESVIRFVPVVFTTAKLFVTQADLGSADLATGDLDADAVSVEEVPWLWFSHNRSPSLCHDHAPESSETDLARAMRREFVRTVAIVGPDGLDAFLQTDLEELLR